MANPDFFPKLVADVNKPAVTLLTHKLASIDGFFIDCLLSDNHTFDAEVTQFPVESGATVSDNIRNKPLVVVMDCLISNTPIGQLASLRDKNSTPTDTAYDLLLKIRADRRPVKIFTSLRTYPNMALQNLSIPRESGRGDELRFTASFVQIELVTNNREKRVAIVGASKGGTRTSNLRAAPVQGTLVIYTDVVTAEWYDWTINAWRAHVVINLHGHFDENHNPVQSEKAPDQFYLLTKGQPSLIPLADWQRRTAAQRTDSAINAQLSGKYPSRNVGTPFPRDGNRIRIIKPGEYVFPAGTNVGVPRTETGTEV